MTAADRPARLRRKGPGRTRRSSASTAPADLIGAGPAGDRSIPRAGWIVVAAKELTDHLSSVRFLVLLGVLGLAAVVPLYFAADQIRSVAAQASGDPANFVALFLLPGPAVAGSQMAVPPAATFIALLAPLLGIAFSFDAVNSERASGTLSRLVSQPIYRDDVINGKFAAGLATIVIGLAMVILLIAGFGIWRLGVVPEAGEIFRVAVWFVMTALYVAFWLAVGLLLSVLLRRAATSALIGFGAWILIALFGGLITGLLSGILAPLGGAQSQDELLSAVAAQELIERISPHQLYSEIASIVLNPTLTTVGTPSTIGQLQQLQQQVPTLLSLDQSLLLIWPQVAALAAMTLACFGLAYVRFMRQEVRA